MTVYRCRGNTKPTFIIHTTRCTNLGQKSMACVTFTEKSGSSEKIFDAFLHDQAGCCKSKL